VLVLVLVLMVLEVVEAVETVVMTLPLVTVVQGMFASELATVIIHVL
jgi:hypothetical protein